MKGLIAHPSVRVSLMTGLVLLVVSLVNPAVWLWAFWAGWVAMTAVAVRQALRAAHE